jgi:KaiC/GvpD/RAD55 family RecA-like ATPase
LESGAIKCYGKVHSCDNKPEIFPGAESGSADLQGSLIIGREKTIHHMAEKDIPEPDTRKMPTGIASLDPVMEGGVPPGSVILMLADIGAGSAEFIYSSVLSLSRTRDRAKDSGDLVFPDSIRYITVTRRNEDVKREISLSFHKDLVASLETIQFEDLSKVYFDSTVVPIDWYLHGDVISRLQNRTSRDMLAYLSEILASGRHNGLVVLDSFTDLATQAVGKGRWEELMAFMRGLQRISKQWNTTIYLPLTRGILDIRNEREIADIVDAVILFQWEESTAARRQRIMYFEKFRGLMPHLEERDLVKFAVRISSATGFEVSNIRVVI